MKERYDYIDSLTEAYHEELRSLTMEQLAEEYGEKIGQFEDEDDDESQTTNAETERKHTMKNYETINLEGSKNVGVNVLLPKGGQGVRDITIETEDRIIHLANVHWDVADSIREQIERFENNDSNQGEQS
jgi:hypothetical protein